MFGKSQRRNQRWLTLTGSRCEITFISASIHDSNEIPTVIPMFSTLGNTIRLLRRMLDMVMGDIEDGGCGMRYFIYTSGSRQPSFRSAVATNACSVTRSLKLSNVEPG